MIINSTKKTSILCKEIIVFFYTLVQSVLLSWQSYVGIYRDENEMDTKEHLSLRFLYLKRTLQIISQVCLVGYARWHIDSDVSK